MFTSPHTLNCPVPRILGGGSGELPPIEDPDPGFDDTVMTTTGTARNGHGSYYGFTAVDGTGTVSVYHGGDASTGTLIHQVANPTLGQFYAVAGGPIECANVWVVQGARTVNYRID